MSTDASMKHFKGFIKNIPNSEPDCSGIFTKACYIEWLRKRAVVAKKPEEAFRKVLVSHIRGSEGRTPFSPAEERNILIIIRKKMVWPCFSDCDTKIGINGFRTNGFHEERILNGLKPSTVCKNVRQRAFYVQVSGRDVFLAFSESDYTGVSKILSKICYETWKKTYQGMNQPEFAFRDELYAHLSGLKEHFPPEVELKILNELRKKRIWPCFEDHWDKSVRDIGNNGFNHKGFHENLISCGQIRKQPVVERLTSERSLPNCHIKKRKTYCPELYFNCFDRQSKTLRNSLHFDPKLESFFNLDEEISRENTSDSQEFDFKFLYEDNVQSLGLDTNFTVSVQDNFNISTYSVLSSFNDVTTVEVNGVIELRKLTKSLFEDYFENVKQRDSSLAYEDNPRDICGDVRLLRTLRLCHGDINMAYQETKDYLKWRLDCDVASIRQVLLQKEISIAELRGNKGSYPFFSQQENGDIIDIWQIVAEKSLNKRDVVVAMRMILKCFEFRSLVLDRLSYMKERIVMHKYIFDCNISKEKMGEAAMRKGYEKWWSAIQQYGWYCRHQLELMTRWYGGFCSKIHVFGTDHFFGLLFSPLGRSIFGSILQEMEQGIKNLHNCSDVLAKVTGKNSSSIDPSMTSSN